MQDAHAKLVAVGTMLQFPAGRGQAQCSYVQLAVYSSSVVSIADKYAVKKNLSRFSSDWITYPFSA